MSVGAGGREREREREVEEGCARSSGASCRYIQGGELRNTCGWLC